MPEDTASGSGKCGANDPITRTTQKRAVRFLTNCYELSRNQKKPKHPCKELPCRALPMGGANRTALTVAKADVCQANQPQKKFSTTYKEFLSALSSWQTLTEWCATSCTSWTFCDKIHNLFSRALKETRQRPGSLGLGVGVDHRGRRHESSSSKWAGEFAGELEQNRKPM